MVLNCLKTNGQYIDEEVLISGNLPLRFEVFMAVKILDCGPLNCATLQSEHWLPACQRILLSTR
jgi:hypothetical protein